MAYSSIRISTSCSTNRIGSTLALPVPFLVITSRERECLIRHHLHVSLFQSDIVRPRPSSFGLHPSSNCSYLQTAFAILHPSSDYIWTTSAFICHHRITFAFKLLRSSDRNCHWTIGSHLTCEVGSHPRLHPAKIFRHECMLSVSILVCVILESAFRNELQGDQDSCQNPISLPQGNEDSHQNLQQYYWYLVIQKPSFSLQGSRENPSMRNISNSTKKLSSTPSYSTDLISTDSESHHSRPLL